MGVALPFRRDANASAWEDQALTAVGRAGAGWSFALEPRSGSGFSERRFVSPGIAASRGTRAVTVWSEPADGNRPGVFHLSVAKNRAEQYAFTTKRTTVGKRGCVPDTLDPDRLFRRDDLHTERLGERRALHSLADEFGVQLPRFALMHGRLHTFRTRPWNRPPGPGEDYLTFMVSPQQP